jgi:hypothetical protein
VSSIRWDITYLGIIIALILVTPGCRTVTLGSALKIQLERKSNTPQLRIGLREFDQLFHFL